jgi:hypothetical protein
LLNIGPCPALSVSQGKEPSGLTVIEVLLCISYMHPVGCGLAGAHRLRNLADIRPSRVPHIEGRTMILSFPLPRKLIKCISETPARLPIRKRGRTAAKRWRASSHAASCPAAQGSSSQTCEEPSLGLPHSLGDVLTEGNRGPACEGGSPQHIPCRCWPFGLEAAEAGGEGGVGRKHGSHRCNQLS